MVTGRAVAAPETVHLTRIVPPPPFPDPLHWVTVALVVFATGAQTTVGSVPPPVPEPMHWLTVAPEVGVPVETSLVNVTLQIKLLPPPTMMPLHWLTVDTNWVDEATLAVQPAGGSTPAAARHAVVVIVELGAPLDETLLTTEILQDTSLPAP